MGGSEPWKPGYTCPTIDSLIVLLKQVKEDPREIESSMQDMLDIIEEIRGYNTSLREWGEYWEAEAGDAREEVATLEDKLDEAESEMIDLLAEMEMKVREAEEGE